MNLLQKYLNKLGLNSYDQLNEEEKATYREWENSISGRKLTDDDVKTFLDIELQTAIGRLTDINLSKEDEIFRKVEVKFIQKILKFLDSPRIEKEMMEKQIGSRL